MKAKDRIFLSLFIFFSLVIIIEACIPSSGSSSQSKVLAWLFDRGPTTAEVVSPTSVSLEGETTLYIGKTNTYQSLFSPENTTDKRVTYEISGDKEAVSLTSDGKLTGLKAGEVTLTATSLSNSSLSSSLVVSISNEPLTSLSLGLSQFNGVIKGMSVKSTVTSNLSETPYNLLSFSSSDTNVATIDENGFIFLDTFIYYSPQSASSLFFFIPSVLLYVGILFWFIYLRYQKTGKLPSKYLFSIFSLIVVFRFISAVSFPYGEQTFTYLFPDTDSLVDVTYSGYSFSDRIIGFTNEILFYSFFLIAIDYYKTFSDKMKIVLRIMQYIVVIAGLALIVAAWIISSKDLIGNLKYYLGDSSATLSEGISSLTSHRNVFGFILMMSTISCFVLINSFPIR